MRDGDYYVLNGQKQFISGAGKGDLYVVMVRTEARYPEFPYDGDDGLRAALRADQSRTDTRPV